MGRGVGLFGRESEKKMRKTSKTLCETDRKGNRPCINPSHFQSEKWQPPHGTAAWGKIHDICMHTSPGMSGQPPDDFSTGN